MVLCAMSWLGWGKVRAAPLADAFSEAYGKVPMFAYHNLIAELILFITINSSDEQYSRPVVR